MCTRSIAFGIAADLLLGVCLWADGPSPAPPSDPGAPGLKATFSRWDVPKLQKTAQRAKLDRPAVYVADRAAQFQGEARWRGMFEFVRDKVRTEVYAGCLRGAEGTLLSMAGNPADKAMLLAALLRAAKIECRFALATAPEELRKKIIAAMFDLKAKPPAVLTKKIPPEQAKALAAPQDDDALLGELAGHVWVQAKVGEDWVDLDPSLATHKAGTPAVQAESTAQALPEDLFQTLTVRVLLIVQKGQDQETQEVLNKAIRVADLADPGAPGLVLVHRLQPAAAGTKDPPVKPVLLWGGGTQEGKAFDRGGEWAAGRPHGGLGDVFDRLEAPAKDDNKPQLLADVLELTCGGASLEDRTCKRHLFDWRGGKPQPGALAEATRALVAMSVLPGRVTQAAVNRSAYMMSAPYRDKADDLRKLQGLLAGGKDAEGGRLYNESIFPALQGGLLWSLRGAAEVVALIADQAQERADRDCCTRTYCSRPRVFLTGWDRTAATVRFDLALKHQRTVVAPGQALALGDAARVLASVFAIAAEAQLPRILPNRKYHSAVYVLQQAQAQKIAMKVFRPGEQEEVDKLAIPPAAKDGIKAHLEKSRHVRAMTKPLDGTGAMGYAWLAFDPAQGEAFTCLPDGSDGAALEVAILDKDILLTRLSAEYLNWPQSVWVAFITYLCTYTGEMIEHCDDEKPFAQIHQAAKTDALGLTRNFLLNALFGGAQPLGQWIVGATLAESLVDSAMRDSLPASP